MPKVSKVVFIHSAHHAEDGSVVKADRFIDRLTVGNVAEMALPLLAAYTPSHIKVEKVEDYFDAIPWNTDADIIAISAQVMQLSRALELTREFKKLGKTVVMGGFLPTMHPELIEKDVDAYCVGEGDLVWPQMIGDLESGNLKKMYKADKQITLENMPTPRYDLIKKDRAIISYPVQATRGCPFSCEYCSIIQFYEKTYRYRPISHIVRDIQATKSKFIHFTDDNLLENKKWSKELLRAMNGLKINWVSQVTINVAQDKELLDLAYESGCKALALGVESLSQQNLNGVQKNFNNVQKFEQVFKSVQDAGIGVHALIVFGFPNDTPQTFDETVTYLENCNVAIAEFFIFTPYPKTPAGRKVFDAGQVIDTDLNHFRESYVVFDHPTMTSQEIKDGYWRAMRKFYSIRSIIKRVWCGTFKDKFYHLSANLYYWAKVKRGIVPVYFGRGN